MRAPANSEIRYPILVEPQMLGPGPYHAAVQLSAEGGGMVSDYEVVVGVPIKIYLPLVPGDSTAPELSGPISIQSHGLLSTSATDPPAVAVTLNGTDQQPADTFAIGDADRRGSGDGWNLQITSTTFSTGGEPPRLLAASAPAIIAVSVSCSQAPCADPANSITYPVTVPAGATPPAAVKFFNAAIDTGMGDFSVTPTFRVTVPANAYAGSYSSTITITIANGP